MMNGLPKEIFLGSEPKDKTMKKYLLILNKIEEWINKLPYSRFKIEITLQDGTEVTLENEKQNICGFIRSDEK